MKKNYGDGVVTLERGKWRVRVPIGGGKYSTIATGIETEREARQLLNAARQERAKMKTGITLRKVGAAWLLTIRELKSWSEIESQWRSIVMDAPFADEPVATLARTDVEKWARALPQKRKKRSVLIAGTGRRKVVELDEPISRKSGALALSYLRLCLAYAVREGHAEANVAEGVEIPIDRGQQVDEPVSYLTKREVDRLLDSDLLTLEQRTVFTLAIFQCPREGELAGMDWSRIDWEGRGWWIAKSWGGTTKNRKTRWQALIERAEQALHAWWTHCGKPRAGIVFPSPRRDDRDQPKRYAKGHDWGWADHPEKHVTRLGLWRRVGIRTRIRFHDLRDTGATHLLSGTWSEPWPIKMVSEHLGHSSTAVTEARYAHTTREALRRHAAGVRFDKNLPQDLPQRSEPASQVSETIAPEVGLEPTTNRLTAVRSALGLRVVADDAAGRRQVWLDAVLEAAVLAAGGSPIPAGLDAQMREAGLELIEAGARLRRGGSEALDVATELAGAIAAELPTRRPTARSQQG